MYYSPDCIVLMIYKTTQLIKIILEHNSQTKLNPGETLYNPGAN